MSVPLQLPMLQKSHIRLQDAHQGRPGPSHQEDTALWCRQHLRAGKAMMPCSPSACPLTRHGNPCISPQHFPSLAAGRPCHTRAGPSARCSGGIRELKGPMCMRVFTAALVPSPLHPRRADSETGGTASWWGLTEPPGCGCAADSHLPLHIKGQGGHQ